MSGSLERRQFFKLASLLTGAVATLAETPTAKALPAGTVAANRAPESVAGETVLHWLDGTPASFTGATFGVPWPQGRVPRDAVFELRSTGAAVAAGARIDSGADGGSGGASHAVAVQSWALAYWPDGI